MPLQVPERQQALQRLRTFQRHPDRLQAALASYRQRLATEPRPTAREDRLERRAARAAELARLRTIEQAQAFRASIVDAPFAP